MMSFYGMASKVVTVHTPMKALRGIHTRRVAVIEARDLHQWSWWVHCFTHCLKTEGHYLVDLRVMENCLKVTKGVDHVFNIAADMGGRGFIQSNHSVIMCKTTMISFNMLEA